MIGPLSYIGGKNRLAKLLISLFPKHTTYVEPFAGGAQVFFHKEPSEVEVLNDLDGDIVNFFRVCQWHYEELVRYLRFCVVSRKLYQQLQATDPRLLTDVQRAGRFFYLQKNCYGGLVLKRSYHYGITQRPNYAVDRVPQLLHATHERLQSVQIESLPYEEILERYDRPTTLFYLDPPYYDRNLYRFNLSKADFPVLNDRLRKLKGRFILSLNDVPEVRTIFSQFHVKPVALAYSSAKGSTKRYGELIISNFKGRDFGSSTAGARQMGKRPDSSEAPAFRLSGFAPAIASLLALGLPAKRLAEIFGTNTNYIHVLAHRGRLSRSQQMARDGLHSKNAITLLAREDSFEAKEALRIRAEEDAVELTGHKMRRLARLEAWMEEIVNGGRNAYRFVQAAQALNALKPFVGYPSESNRLRFAAKLHQYLSWFYSHGGLTSLSIREATYSIRLYEIVYQNTGDSDALRELGGSCLIRSNSYLLQGDANAALATLNLAKEGTLAAGVPLNSEYFRQFGVALFQTRQDTMAKTMFERAMATIPDSDLKNGTMTLRMAGDRHLNLIAAPFPNLDDELILLNEAKAVFGDDSLEDAMCVNWAAACALCTSSAQAQALALDLIQENQPNVARFPHRQ